MAKENVIDLSSVQDFIKLATQKLDEELKTFKGDRYGQAVKDHVAATLKHFCEQDVRFAKVVYQTKRTLSDCCAEIMKGCGQSISDIDVYRGAVRNYFPNADVTFHMTISITGEAPTEEEMNREPKVKAPEPKKKAETTPAPKPAAKAPVEKPKPVAPAPKPASKPATKPAKKEKPKAQDPEIIQLTLF